MDNKKLFVVHRPSLGWDSVQSTLYKASNEKSVLKYLMNNYGISMDECEDEYVVTEIYDTEEINNVDLLSDELANRIEKFIVKKYGINPIEWHDISGDIIYPFLKEYLDENDI